MANNFLEATKGEGFPFVDEEMGIKEPVLLYIKPDRPWSKRRIGSSLSILWKAVETAYAAAVPLGPRLILGTNSGARKLYLQNGRRLVDLCSVNPPAPNGVCTIVEDIEEDPFIPDWFKKAKADIFRQYMEKQRKE